MAEGDDIIDENENDDVNETSSFGSTYSSDDSLKILDFSKGMSDQFLIYANEVIGYRAIPDIRDGLKPVHRRILYGMYTNEYRSSDKPKKSVCHRFEYSVYPETPESGCECAVDHHRGCNFDLAGRASRHRPTFSSSSHLPSKGKTENPDFQKQVLPQRVVRVFYGH